MCLNKDEEDHGPLEHQRTSRLSDGPFCSLPGALHANNGHQLQDILFKTFNVVVSESKNKILVSRIVFLLFTLKCMEVILPHPIYTVSVFYIHLKREDMRNRYTGGLPVGRRVTG